MKVIAKNKRAYFDYEILKKYQAGIELLGSEIKSIREGHTHIKGSFVSVRNGQVYWKGGFIKTWRFTSHNQPDETRDRRLLLHKREIRHLEKALNEQGKTIVPVTLGLVRGRAKLEIALATGKKQYDKRQSIKNRDIQRNMLHKEKYR